MTTPTLEKLSLALNLKRQIGKLEAKFHKLFQSNHKKPRKKLLLPNSLNYNRLKVAEHIVKTTPKRKGITPAGRARIAKAQRERWAKIKGAK